jgi:Fic family protein
MSNSASNLQRAGRYVTQPAGYRAFVPTPLPPDPPLRLDFELATLLSEASASLGRLDSASDLLPNADLFVAMYVRKEAVLSSQIEGTQASLVDVLAFEAEAAEPENPQDIEEVVNYVAALNYGLERLETLPLSLRLIREIHERLMAGVRGSEKHPGEFRTSQNWIGRPGSTINTAMFVPPAPDDMRQALNDIERFLHAPERIPPLIKMGLAHAQFETVHPFLDGNGRMGRLLITFYLCQQRILRKPLLYLSHYFRLNQQEYYERLQRIRDAGEWEEWVTFFLTGVRDVAEEAAATARSIMLLRERHRELLATELGKGVGNGIRLLTFLFKRPITTVNLVAKHLEVTYGTANSLVAKCTALGILRAMDQRERGRRFIYADYLSLFTEDIPGIADSENMPPDITRP